MTKEESYKAEINRIFDEAERKMKESSNNHRYNMALIDRRRNLMILAVLLCMLALVGGVSLVLGGHAWGVVIPLLIDPPCIFYLLKPDNYKFK